jgi:hypothetical protein
MARSTVFARSGERRVISNVVKGSIGNLIERYDWYTYAAFSIYVAATFFPQGNATAQLLLAGTRNPFGGYRRSVPLSASRRRELL